MKIRLTIFAIIMIAFGSCMPRTAPSIAPTSSLATSSNGGASALFEQIGKTAADIKPHADPTGQSLSDQVVGMASDGKKKTDSTDQGIAAKDAQIASLAKQLEIANHNTIDAKKDGDARIAKAVADGHAPVVKAFWACSILGLLGAIVCWIAYEQTSMPWLERVAIGCVALCGSSIVLSIAITMSVAIAAQVTPIFVWCVGALAIACTAIGIAIVAYEGWTRGRAIVEKWLNSLGMQTVSASTAKVMKNLVGSISAPIAAKAA